MTLRVAASDRVSCEPVDSSRARNDAISAEDEPILRACRRPGASPRVGETSSSLLLAHRKECRQATMAPKQTQAGGGREKIPDKLTDAEKKKKKQENKAKANPVRAQRPNRNRVPALGRRGRVSPGGRACIDAPESGLLLRVAHSPPPLPSPELLVGQGREEEGGAGPQAREAQGERLHQVLRIGPR